jgi:hypothetical protein
MYRYTQRLHLTQPALTQAKAHALADILESGRSVVLRFQSAESAIHPGPDELLCADALRRL